MDNTRVKGTNIPFLDYYGAACKHNLGAFLPQNRTLTEVGNHEG